VGCEGPDGSSCSDGWVVSEGLSMLRGLRPGAASIPAHAWLQSCLVIEWRVDRHSAL
jgi:hypothetical protein